MVPEDSRYSFFQHPTTPRVKRLACHLYNNTKAGHDIRFGYSILTKNIKKLYPDIPFCSSAAHLSYLLPSISFLSSLLIEDILSDKRALFWAIMNAAQCYVHDDFFAKLVTIVSYALDIYFSYVGDIKWLSKHDAPEYNIYTRYFIGYSESIYAALILGVVLADIFHRTEIGLGLLAISVFIKLSTLIRDWQMDRMFYLTLNACIISFSPIGLLFAVRNDFGLTWSLCLLVSVVHLLNASSEKTPSLCSVQSCGAEEDRQEQTLKAETMQALQLV